MVNLQAIFTFIFFAVANLFAVNPPPDPTSVETEVQWDNIYENQPIEGFITVTHDRQFKVDAESFSMNGKPLKVTFDKEVTISSSSPLILSIYRFTIPGMARGIQVLPEISVKVNGKIYKSPPISFQVLGAEKQAKSLQPFLRLETIGGEKALYPGSRTQVGYRYLYNTNIELTKEYLPLLDAENLKKIGDKDIKDIQQGIMTIHTILQNVEAVEPGTFSYGPSIVAGNAYQERGGRRVYVEPQLVAEAPIVTITVKDFPSVGRPTSFNGAVGQFTFKVTIVTNPKVRLGDKIELKLEITGSGQLDNVKPPDLCCQPGFSGLFKTSDLPVAGQIVGTTKTFQVELYPLSIAIDFIPPIEFSYFNPAKEKYESIVSKEIPIQVLPAPEANKSTILEPEAKKAAAIRTIYPLSSSDLHNKKFGSFWVLALIPLGLVAIFFQYSLIFEREKIKKVEQSSSKKLFNTAMVETEEQIFFNKLHKAFQLLLYEKGVLANPTSPLVNLPTQFAPIEEFLAEGEALRFSKHPSLDVESFKRKAKELFKKYS